MSEGGVQRCGTGSPSYQTTFLSTVCKEQYSMYVMKESEVYEGLTTIVDDVELGNEARVDLY